MTTGPTEETVSHKDIYLALGQIKGQLDGMRGDIQEFKDANASQEQRWAERAARTEVRVSSLERSRAWVLGAAAVIGGGLAIWGEKIAALISTKGA